MTYNFNPIKNKIKEIEEWLVREYQAVRTGRATPFLLDGVVVNSYNAHVPLKQVAAVTIEDARSLRVNPWDKNQIKEVETAITAANLGVSVAADSSGLRIIFPELTAESRTRMAKVVHTKLEEARVNLRQARDRVWTELQTEERSGKISEDDKFRFKDGLQKIIDEGNQKLEAVAKKKETEILN
ncbi:MAG: ribosome recycling factor [Patescibacteria group bacterium]